MTDTTKSAIVLIAAIAKRAVDTVFKPQGVSVEMIDVMMDLEHTHELMPLRLQDFLDADDGNFGHDIAGIYRHFNRQTLAMDNGFVPRFTAAQPDKFVMQVAEQSVEYAIKYRCSLATALDDWEGNGPDGSFGLQDQERTQAETYLRTIGYNLDARLAA